MIPSLIRSVAARVALVGVVAAAAGCSAGYTKDNTSSVLMIVAGVNGGSVYDSDVLTDGAVAADRVPVDLAFRFKNPLLEPPSIPNAVIIDRYEVRYRRSDNRGVEGQDVPYPISGNVTAGFDVKSSGTDPINIEVVRAQAKLEPPLRNLRGVVTGALGGSFIVTMFADITLHGHTISGQTVSGTGTLQIDFADFPDN